MLVFLVFLVVLSIKTYSRFHALSTKDWNSSIEAAEQYGWELVFWEESSGGKCSLKI